VAARAQFLDHGPAEMSGGPGDEDFFHCLAGAFIIEVPPLKSRTAEKYGAAAVRVGRKHWLVLN
jgi:hypothetical protein